MEEMLVVEYKVKGELFCKKFAYTEKCLDALEGFIYINPNSREELTINRECLEYRLERVLRIDEEI